MGLTNIEDRVFRPGKPLLLVGDSSDFLVKQHRQQGQVMNFAPSKKQVVGAACVVCFELYRYVPSTFGK